MNAAQVRAKARMAMKRREEQIEDEEMEAGELNLVPYLDIVTNVMLFLLATVTSGLVLGNINSALPEYSPPGTAGQQNAPQTEEQEPPLQMTAAVAPEKITIFSVTGKEGTIDKPLLELPAKVRNEDFDYAKITEAMQGVIDRHYKGRPPLGLDKTGKPVCITADGKPLEIKACRPTGGTEVILIVDASIPYKVIVSVMDALRQNNAKDSTYPDNLLFPDVIFATGITN
jgi:biopolymer transport protein TolR